MIGGKVQIGTFGDDDFPLGIKKAGYKTICAEDIFIHHFGKSSFKKLAEGEYQAPFNKNRALFESKWNMRWEPHK